MNDRFTMLPEAGRTTFLAVIVPIKESWLSFWRSKVFFPPARGCYIREAVLTYK